MTSLFPPSLIPTTVTSSLPPNYKLRPLSRSDHNTGFLSVLADLTTVGEISQSGFEAQYDAMAGTQDTYYCIVIEDAEGRVVATGVVFTERKFIHQCGKVGHIEDIAVARDQQGKRLGKMIILALDGIAQAVGCYKTVLDCEEKNVGFYEKCGYTKKEWQMAHYFI